jgi:alpha-beta hydrolase superfamily lysophospholipase
VAQGGYEDFSARLGEDIRQLQAIAPLFEAGVRGAYRLGTGASIDALSPIAAIPAIAPRPVLLIYGTSEPSIAGARAMAALGVGHVRLAEIPGATHGSYQTTGPAAWREAVLELLDTLAGG